MAKKCSGFAQAMHALRAQRAFNGDSHKELTNEGRLESPRAWCNKMAFKRVATKVVCM